MQDISGHIDTIAISYLAIAESPDLMLHWNLTTFCTSRVQWLPH
jgi:hypothetical protein